MNVKADTFEELVKAEWDYPSLDGNNRGTALSIHAADADVAGSPRYITDIDRLKDYPDASSVTVFGLDQDTFEYLIRTYGKQFRYISFFRNKMVQDWSLLGTLPDLECVYWYCNRKISKLWDMSGNLALKAVVLDDFTKLRDLDGIEKAPSLEWFGFGNAVWSAAGINSLKPLAGTSVRRIDFFGKKIGDMDISFIPSMKDLQVFNFPTNLFTTEEVAGLVALRPDLTGYSLKPYVEFQTINEKTKKADVPAVIIVGKRKPTIVREGNEQKILDHVEKFNLLVDSFRKAGN